jgi:hypothetical protein
VLVNWCELTLTRESDGKLLYHNAFITHYELSDDTVPAVVSAGRSRWKTENENHNVLKTKGYHLEHNFGYGQHHLAATLLALNLLAFLFHTACIWSMPLTKRFERHAQRVFPRHPQPH